jgi:hypothetical protein
MFERSPFARSRGLMPADGSLKLPMSRPMGSWLVYPAFHTVAFREKKAFPARAGTDAPTAPAEVHTGRLQGGEQAGGTASLAQRIARVSDESGEKASDPSRYQPDDKSEPPRFWLLPEVVRRNVDREFSDEPPLPVELLPDEIRELQDERVVVATHFGPKAQEKEKASNEDFALGGVLRLGRQGETAFVAIADGVSTRTFWAARTARIACLTTYKTARRLLENGLDLGRPDSVAEIAEALAPAIEDSLKADAQRLESAGTVPAGWNPVTYQKYKSDRSLWYRSTLLFGLAGQRGSVIGYVGDGGIRTLIVPERRGEQPVEKCILQAEDDGQLSNYVSIGFTAAEIRRGHFVHEGRAATHVLFASDGLDKTLRSFQRPGAEAWSRYRDVPLATRAEGFGFLGEISAREGADMDNFSIARLSWPLASRWPAWRQEPPSRWRYSGGSAREPTSGAPTTLGAPSENGDAGEASSGKRTMLLAGGLVLLGFLLGAGAAWWSNFTRGPPPPGSIDDLLKADMPAKVTQPEREAKAKGQLGRAEKTDKAPPREPGTEME